MHTSGNLTRQLRHLRRFLNELHDHQRDLARCRQSDIDAWFAQPGQSHKNIRAFLTWAKDHRHLSRELDLPPARTRSARNAIDQQQRWDVARRLVEDDTIEPDDRLAAAFVVLYAQPLTRVAALAISDVRRDGDRVTVNFDGHDIDLPEPFATIATQLPRRRHAGPADHLPTRWLFPARRPDKHLGINALRSRLNALGIDPRQMRIAALAQLASQIPPAVLAKAIGITARTASKAVTLNGGNWARYASP